MPISTIKGTSNLGGVSKSDLEQVVPKRMDDITGIDLMTESASSANIYVDSNGTDKKISLQTLMDTLVSSLPRYNGNIE